MVETILETLILFIITQTTDHDFQSKDPSYQTGLHSLAEHGIGEDSLDPLQSSGCIIFFFTTTTSSSFYCFGCGVGGRVEGFDAFR
jgi:hypothetical protein